MQSTCACLYKWVPIPFLRFMAKRRKGRTGEAKVEGSNVTVHHQKLCLAIDIDKRRIYGYTEMRISIPDDEIIALFADELEIEGVLVDGQQAEFEVFPHFQLVEIENRWCSVSSVTSAADAAGSTYISALERETVPNLLIMCPKSGKSISEQDGQCNEDNGTQTEDNGTQKEDEYKKLMTKLVHIDYWVAKEEAGIHFGNNILLTDNQIRRGRCWFPCMSGSAQLCRFDLEFTVAHNLVAVSAGTLLCQVLNREIPSQKTYVYKVDVPVSARCISLAVAPFEIYPDSHNGSLSYMSLPGNLSGLRNVIGVFHSAFSHYEDYLASRFPFGLYKQVFVTPEIASSSLNLSASMSIFSSQLLFDERIIDQTIHTRIKLAYALARQWFGVYISAESQSDEWLLEGLAGFLTDSYVKRFLGNNEAQHWRYKANCAICKADDFGVTALCSTSSLKDLHGTHTIGFYGKIRSWKSVAVLQMLEKQMGPESFRKVLQIVLLRANDPESPLRTLSTKEFRHLANKAGNLERPFLKEFFQRWVEACGCPAMKIAPSYNKRKNMVELAVLRECSTAAQSSQVASHPGNPIPESRESEAGWPGMMSIRVHELDGMYDHPVLSMAGDTWQLLEMQCHSKLGARRLSKPKKSTKPDGSDDNGDVSALPSDPRPNLESPLLWLRADPEMEYLAQIYFNQSVPMWINQLEKDKDVVAQAQAIAALESLPHLSFSVVNALYNFLCDSKAFWRVRIEAAYALATTASENTDWAGLLHLFQFYKNQRFDTDVGLPRANDFHDFAEYFVLEAVPHAVSMVRGEDRKSPREAVEFVLQLLKYNDNDGNPFSDAYWLAALVQSAGDLEFSQHTIVFLSSLLKRIDRILQFDKMIPSHGQILTISCIGALTQIALKLSRFVPFDRIVELIGPYCGQSESWRVRIEASRALLDLKFHCQGIDAALFLFLQFTGEETSMRGVSRFLHISCSVPSYFSAGQVKLAVHAVRLCRRWISTGSSGEIKGSTLVSLLRLLESRASFKNVIFRHHVFCILQVLAGRRPTLYGVGDRSLQPASSADEACVELKENLVALFKQAKAPPPIDAEPSREVEGEELQKKSMVKIKLRSSSAAAVSGSRTETWGAHSSVSVDAPSERGIAATAAEEADSFCDVGFFVTGGNGCSIRCEDQCTTATDDVGVQKFACLRTLLTSADEMNVGSERERPHGDQDHLEKKRRWDRGGPASEIPLQSTSAAPVFGSQKKAPGARRKLRIKIKKSTVNE